jgi:ribonuclease P protein component
MFPRSQRLTEERLFGLLFKRGKRSKGRDFSIVFFPANKSGKIGFIVTKKVAKSAVDRNRLKRRLRSAFKAVLATEPMQQLLPRYNIAVVIHRNVSQVPFDALLKQVYSQLLPLSKEVKG